MHTLGQEKGEIGAGPVIGTDSPRSRDAPFVAQEPRSR